MKFSLLNNTCYNSTCYTLHKGTVEITPAVSNRLCPKCQCLTELHFIQHMLLYFTVIVIFVLVVRPAFLSTYATCVPAV